MKKTFLFFTGKNCPACATMKANMAKAGIEYDEISTDTMAGSRYATANNVRSLPTLLVFNDTLRTDSYIGALPVSELEKIKGMAK